MELKFNERNDGQVNYYFFNAGISSEIINKIIKDLSFNFLLFDASIGNAGAVNRATRRTKVCWVPKTEQYAYIYNIVHNYVKRANDECFHFHINEISESIQYGEYREDDQGYYDWHIDCGEGLPRRKLSLVIQLSDPSEYEGGELQINTGNIRTVSKDKGTAIVFPSYLVHRVTPVTKGIRKSLVCWIDGPPLV